MPTYRSKAIANTWTSFSGGVLSAQGRSLPTGITVVGQEAGLSHTGDAVIKFGDLYSKLKWFDTLPVAPAPSPETELPAELRGFDANGNPVEGAVWTLQ